jgi:hypothetical protein
VEEGFERRLYFPDVRGGGRYLRVTWHPDTATIVLSHWRDGLCVASTPISLTDATRLIGLIVGALKESAVLRPNVPGSGPASGAAGSWLTRLRGRFQPRLAQIVRLPERGRAPGPQGRDRAK